MNLVPSALSHCFTQSWPKYDKARVSTGTRRALDLYVLCRYRPLYGTRQSFDRYRSEELKAVSEKVRVLGKYYEIN